MKNFLTRFSKNVSNQNVSKEKESSNDSALKKPLISLLCSIMLLIIISPVLENWEKTPGDDFPLSYYPMFSKKRSDQKRVIYIVGLTSKGERRLIRHDLLGGEAGLNQVRRQIRRMVRAGKADQLCQQVAEKIINDPTNSYKEVNTIQIVSGIYSLANYFSGDKKPISEEVYSSYTIKDKL